MHGFRRSEEDETDRITRERKTDEMGSFAKGDNSCLGVWGSCCHTLFVVVVEVATDDLGLLVRLTYLGVRTEEGVPARGRKGRRAAFIVMVGIELTVSGRGMGVDKSSRQEDG